MERIKFSTILTIVFVQIAIWMLIQNISQSFSDVRIDFPSFYYAANMAFDGQSPYSKELWDSANDLHLPNQELFPFLHIPFSLILFYPLTLFSYQTAQTILFVLNLILVYSIIAFLFIKILGKSTNDPFSLLGGIFIILFFPVNNTIYHGQLNLLVVFLICVFWYFIRENRVHILAGCALAFAILLKVYPAVFLLFLLIKKRFKSMLLAVGIVFLFSLLAFIFLPNSIWMDWYLSIGEVGYEGVFAERISFWKAADQSFNGFISRLFLGVSSLEIPSLTDAFIDLKPWQKTTIIRFMDFGSFFLMIVVWLYLVLRKKHCYGVRPRWDLEISMLLVTQFLIAPISWDHHLVFILPAIFVLLDILRSRESRHLRVIVLGLALFLAFDIDIANPLFRDGFLSILISSQFFAVFALWIVFVIVISSKTLSQLDRCEANLQ